MSAPDCDLGLLALVLRKTERADFVAEADPAGRHDIAIDAEVGSATRRLHGTQGVDITFAGTRIAGRGDTTLARSTHSKHRRPNRDVVPKPSVFLEGRATRQRHRHPKAAVIERTLLKRGN